jgi:hypothetical protein
VDEIAGQLAHEIVTGAVKCTEEIMSDLTQTDKEQSLSYSVLREIVWCFMHIQIRIGDSILGPTKNGRLMSLVGPRVAWEVVMEYLPFKTGTPNKIMMALLNGYNAVQPEYLYCEDLLVDPPFSKRAVLDALVFRLIALLGSNDIARAIEIRFHIIKAVHDLRLRPLIERAVHAS